MYERAECVDYSDAHNNNYRFPELSPGKIKLKITKSFIILARLTPARIGDQRVDEKFNPTC